MCSMQASDREIPPLWLMLRQLSTASRTRRNATGKWEESRRDTSGQAFQNKGRDNISSEIHKTINQIETKVRGVWQFT